MDDIVYVLKDHFEMSDEVKNMSEEELDRLQYWRKLQKWKKKRLKQGRRKNFAYDLTQKACNFN